MMRFNIKKRITLIILIFAIVGILQYLSYYHKLKNQENEYIITFFKSGFKGSLTYKEQYGENQDTYVIGITDSSGNEKTIGKVEITDFSKSKIVFRM